MYDCLVLDSTLFSRLPDFIIYEICIFTGKFKLRIDKYFHKLNLVSIIDLHDKLWINFNINLDNLIKKRIKKRIFDNNANRIVECSISRNGDLRSTIRLNITLPPLQHNNQQILPDINENIYEFYSIISQNRGPGPIKYRYGRR